MSIDPEITNELDRRLAHMYDWMEARLRVHRSEVQDIVSNPRVDRVARALCDRFDTQDAPVQDRLREQARKAIDAMEVGK